MKDTDRASEKYVDALIEILEDIVHDIKMDQVSLAISKIDALAKLMKALR